MSKKSQISQCPQIISNAFSVLSVPFSIQSNVFNTLSDSAFSWIVVFFEKILNFMGLFIRWKILSGELAQSGQKAPRCVPRKMRQNKNSPNITPKFLRLAWLSLKFSNFIFTEFFVFFFQSLALQTEELFP